MTLYEHTPIVLDPMVIGAIGHTDKALFLHEIATGFDNHSTRLTYQGFEWIGYQPQLWMNTRLPWMPYGNIRYFYDGMVKDGWLVECKPPREILPKRAPVAFCRINYEVIDPLIDGYKKSKGKSVLVTSTNKKLVLDTDTDSPQNDQKLESVLVTSTDSKITPVLPFYRLPEPLFAKFQALTRARGIVNLNTGREESWKPILSTQDRDKDSSVSTNVLTGGASAEEKGSKPRVRKDSSSRGESGSAQRESRKPGVAESTTTPPPKAPRPKAPQKLHSRFTGTKWYAVNEDKCSVGHKAYSKAEADEAAQRLTDYGYSMVKGNLLNADLKYKTYKVIGGSLDTNGTSPAWKAFEESAPLMGDGDRIVLLLDALAQRENMLLSDLKASEEMALKIRAVYKMCADEDMTPPTGVGAFIRQWNRKHHPPSFKQQLKPGERLVMVPLPDNRSAIRADEADSQKEAS